MPSQAGIALVVVLWGLALLSVMVAGFAFVTRAETTQVTHLVEKAKLRAAAEAAVSHAVMDLYRPVTERSLPGDGTPAEWRYGDVLVRLAVADESGKVDLNAGKREHLQGLLAYLGLALEEQQALVDAVEDWRDADQARRTHGAEDDDYAAAGLPFGAKDAPFDSVDELHQVLGMTPELVGRLEPLVTVFNKRPGVDAGAAPAAVLLALPDVDQQVVLDYLDRRAENREGGLPPPPFPQAGARRTGAGGGAYRVRVEAHLEGGASAVLEAVVRLSVQAPRMYEVMAWKEGHLAEAPASGGE